VLYLLLLRKKKYKEVNLFENIGANVGLLFQIADDLIDFRGSSIVAGKKTGKDKKKGKATLISLLGYENVIKYSDKIKFEIINDLKKYGERSNNLNETLDYILTRNK
jgi:farnesyl diphosphate synthase